MAAKNVNMVELAQNAAPMEVQPPTFGELSAALQQATNSFLKAHLTQMLGQFVKDNTTIAHILTIHEVKCDITALTNIFAPYTKLTELAQQHVIANDWKAGEEFTPEVSRGRFSPTSRIAEKYPDPVSNGSINHLVYKTYVINHFKASRDRAHKAAAEEMKKTLSLLQTRTQPTARTASRSRSRSRTPNAQRARSSSKSNSRTRQSPNRPARGAKRNQSRAAQGRETRQDGRRIPFGQHKQAGHFSFTHNGEHWIWSDAQRRYKSHEQQQPNPQQRSGRGRRNDNRPRTSYNSSNSNYNNNNNNNNNNQQQPRGRSNGPQRDGLVGLALNARKN